MATRGSGGISPPPPPGKFRSSQIASDAIWNKLSKQHILATMITILNFKISGGGGEFWLGAGENSRAPTPLYETLSCDILHGTGIRKYVRL